MVMLAQRAILSGFLSPFPDAMSLKEMQKGIQSLLPSFYSRQQNLPGKFIFRIGAQLILINSLT